MSQRTVADALGLKTHIPSPKFAMAYTTMCGRRVNSVLCIDLRTTPIDEATCQACHRSDDRRVRQAYAQEIREKSARKREAWKERGVRS